MKIRNHRRPFAGVVIMLPQSVAAAAAVNVVLRLLLLLLVILITHHSGFGGDGAWFGVDAAKNGGDRRRGPFDTLQRTWRNHIVPAQWQEHQFKTKTGYTPLVFFTMPRGTSPECDALEEFLQELERDDPTIKIQRLNVRRDPAAEATMVMVGRVIQQQQEQQLQQQQQQDSATATTTSIVNTNDPVQRRRLLRMQQMQQQQQRMGIRAPFLYHRESLQSVQIFSMRSQSSKGNKKRTGTSDDDDENNNKRTKDDDVDDEKETSVMSPTAVAAMSIPKNRIRAWAKGRFLPRSSMIMMMDDDMAARMDMDGRPMLDDPFMEDDADWEEQQQQLEQQADWMEDMSLTPLQRQGKQAIRDRTEQKAREREEKLKQRNGKL